MKKIIISLIVLLLLTGCVKDMKVEKMPEINDEKINPYVDTNPIKIGLYENNKLVKRYVHAPYHHTDIGVFNIYFTNKEQVDPYGIKYNFNKYYKEYKDIDNYKIGFYIEYETKNKKIEQIVKDPSSMHAMSPFVYTYLYDDIHQPDGAWYSHLEMKDMNDNTIISSIKLFYAERPEDIIFPIKVTVFTYDSEDDFDENGQYRGNSHYTMEIYDK